MRWIASLRIDARSCLVWLTLGIGNVSVQQPEAGLFSGPRVVSDRIVRIGAAEAAHGPGAMRAFPAKVPDTVLAESVSSEPRKDPACRPTPLIIAYHGDSTVEGTPIEKPAPTIFASMLPSGAVVSNEGVGGATARMLLEGTDGRHPPWAVWLSRSPAPYVIINHALNDHSAYDVTTYSDLLLDIVDTAQSAGKIVVLETPNPTRYSSTLKAYVSAMKFVSVEKKTYLIDQFSHLNSYMIKNHLTINEITYDGVHPTQETHALKGAYAAEVFLKTIIPQTHCR